MIVLGDVILVGNVFVCGSVFLHDNAFVFEIVFMFVVGLKMWSKVNIFVETTCRFSTPFDEY